MTGSDSGTIGDPGIKKVTPFKAPRPGFAGRGVGERGWGEGISEFYFFVHSTIPASH